MKNKMIALMIILTTIGFGSWWFFNQGHQTNHRGHQHGRVKKTSKYLCSMHPQIIENNPGKCPICGMTLVPIEDNHEKENDPAKKSPNHSNHQEKFPDGHVNFILSSEKQQMIGIKITQAKRKKLFKSIRAPGRIAFDPDLYTAQSEYLEALKQWRNVKHSPISAVKENIKQMIRSSRIRLKVLGLSNGQIKALAKKGSQSEGLLVSGKEQDNWVYADVFEVDLPYLKKGLSAQITAKFLQGKILHGKIISVDQIINPETRTAKVRIQLMKTDASIRPESYVNITISAPVGEHIAVPLEAIMDTGRESFVFIKKGQGQFKPRRVNVLLETDNEAAVTGSVMPGEEVVVGGNFMLDSESRLKSVIQEGTSYNETITK